MLSNHLGSGPFTSIPPSGIATSSRERQENELLRGGSGIKSLGPGHSSQMGIKAS